MPQGAISAHTWSYVLAAITLSLPYVLALTALVQSWAAYRAAKFAKRQAQAANDQLEVLRKQIRIEEAVAMVDLAPTFEVTPVGPGELGVLSTGAGGALQFVPLDDESRLHPERWVRRRTVVLRCNAAPESLIVELEAAPEGVQNDIALRHPTIPGTTHRGDILVPFDVDEREVTLLVTSHVASDPAKLWKQQICCFPRA